jgi:hypothetical protein
MLHDGNSRLSLREGPWNPGIESTLTRELLTYATIFRPENVFSDLARAIELHDTTGIVLEELAIFRPERLALHEILVRVAADFEVPDPASADERSLGITYRHMAWKILSRTIGPCQDQLAHEYNRLKSALAKLIEEELSVCFAQVEPSPATGPASNAFRGLWQRVRRPAADRPPPTHEPDLERDHRVLQTWRARAENARSPFQTAACRALLKVASAVHAKLGRLPRQADFLGELATELACNEYGSEAIGRLIEPAIRAAAEQEGFRELPAQAEPALIITKGASASGKSTMRPLQRMLAAKMGLHWGNFALISPDVWRRVLLDFESLGPLYRYAGMLTSQELAIIDEKLYRYLLRKGQRGSLSHLWVDRFRFADTEESQRLVSHFGKVRCYFFMITPPHETVERAWRRGLEVGRYKAVDDVLAHNVEAFAGMQNILFARALTPNPSLHFEFLDNSVPRGTTPLTVAFGCGGEMNVLDVPRMLDMCRYQKINVDARGADEVYPDAQAMSPERNIGFLSTCVRRFPELNFVDRGSGRIYAHFALGNLLWTDPEALACSTLDAETRASLHIVAPTLFTASGARQKQSPRVLPKSRFLTIGQWGEGATAYACR